MRREPIPSRNLSVNLGKIRLRNPVIVASGTFGFGEEFEDFFDLNELGAIIPKGISLKPMAGNPPPRLFETEGGILNSIGLQNPGVDVFMKEKLPYFEKIRTPLIVNFFGTTEREYVELARRLAESPRIEGLEMNISCPNVRKCGVVFSTDPRMTYRLVRAVRKAVSIPLMVKLSPNVTDIAAIARSAEEGGADAVSLINTIRAMAVNIHTRRAELGNIIGGLSGPAIKPIALRMVWEVKNAVSIPVIGMGGIMKAEDAIEFLMVGATAIQIGTANLVNPGTALAVARGIREYLDHHGLRKVPSLLLPSA